MWSHSNAWLDLLHVLSHRWRTALSHVSGLATSLVNAKHLIVVQPLHETREISPLKLPLMTIEVRDGTLCKPTCGDKNTLGRALIDNYCSISLKGPTRFQRRGPPNSAERSDEAILTVYNKPP